MRASAENVLQADALIEEGRRAERTGDMTLAIGRYAAAAALAPEYALGHLNLAIALEHEGRTAEAAQAYERALNADPRAAQVCYNFGRFLYLQGDLARVIPLLDIVLKSAPFADAWILLAAVLENQDKLADAAAALRNALESEPQHGGALRNYALLLMRQGRLNEAAQAWEKIIALEPDTAEPRYQLGNVLADAGRLDDAASQYAAAAALDPGFLEAKRSLYMLECERGAPARAVSGLEALVAARPDYVAGYLSLGAALVARHDYPSAIRAFRRALELDSSSIEALIRLGDLSTDASAVDYYRTAAAIDPENVRPRWCSVVAHLRPVWPNASAASAGRRAFSAALEEFERWITEGRLAQGVDAIGAPPPFALAYGQESNRDLLERHGRLCTTIAFAWARSRSLRAPARRNYRERVRVGVVSAYFWDHSVWTAIARGWFEVLDRSRFELESYHVGFERDVETRRAESLASRFEYGSSSLSHWTDLIASREVDILLFPEVGMDATTMKLASLRLAPIQVASWGHPETTGLPTIDYYLSAAGMEPPEADLHYSERLVTLPGLGVWYPRRDINPETPHLEELPDDGAPLLLCPGTPFKYAPEHDSMLVSIAAALGECRLVFFNYRAPDLSRQLETRLREAFSASGLDARKFVRFIPWQTPARFRGLMRRAHAFLDTAGFSGFNTVMEAVQSECPVVAWEGRFLRGRFGSGILTRMGLQDLVARDAATYVSLAVRLCRDAGFRQSVRNRMAAGAGKLFEDPAPVHAFGEFLSTTRG